MRKALIAMQKRWKQSRERERERGLLSSQYVEHVSTKDIPAPGGKGGETLCLFLLKHTYSYYSF